MNYTFLLINNTVSSVVGKTRWRKIDRLTWKTDRLLVGFYLGILKFNQTPWLEKIAKFTYISNDPKQPKSSTLVEEKVTSRIDFLRKTDARVKFLSLEPLIGPLPNLNLDNIDWVIVGGESGFNPRAMDADWVLEIQEQCTKNNVAFFF